MEGIAGSELGLTGGLMSVPPAGTTSGTSEDGEGIAGDDAGGDALGALGASGARGPALATGLPGAPPGTGIAGSVSRPLGGGIVGAKEGADGTRAGGMNSAGLGGSTVTEGALRDGLGPGSAVFGSCAMGSERSVVASVGAASGQMKRTAANPAARLHAAASAIPSCLREKPLATQPRNVLLPGAGGGSFSGPFASGLSGGFGAPEGMAGLVLEMTLLETSIGMASVIPDLPS
jgi:hypothetical protein